MNNLRNEKLWIYLKNLNKLVMDEEGNLFFENLLIPKPSVQRKILREKHTAHMDITKTVAYLKQFFWWSTLCADV